MDKTRTVGQKWLANELDLHFLTLKKCTKGHSNRSILSKVILLTNYKSTDRQIHRQPDRQAHSRKPFFRVQRVSKRGPLTKKRGGGGHILHKSNTFSDVNVITESQILKEVHLITELFICKTENLEREVIIIIIKETLWSENIVIEINELLIINIIVSIL